MISPHQQYIVLVTLCCKCLLLSFNDKIAIYFLYALLNDQGKKRQMVVLV